MRNAGLATCLSRLRFASSMAARTSCNTPMVALDESATWYCHSTRIAVSFSDTRTSCNAPIRTPDVEAWVCNSFPSTAETRFIRQRAISMRRHLVSALFAPLAEGWAASQVCRAC